MHTNLIGIVVSSKNFGDSDKLVILLTKDLGLIKCIAKGIRKINSKRSSSIDSCNLISVKASKKQDFYYISESKSINNFSSIKSNLVVSGWAYYCLELTSLVAQESVEEVYLYSSLLNTLKSLDENPSKRTIYKFLKGVVISQGYWDVSFEKNHPYLNLINTTDTVNIDDQKKIDRFFTNQITKMVDKEINSLNLLNSFTN